MIGIDLFSGAGGMSLGARMAGIDVVMAVEADKNAAATYQANHPDVEMVINDIRLIDDLKLCNTNKKIILFGGPPCQGLSTSNQRTRNVSNPSNWLFKDFFRIARIVQPDYIVFENVKGMVETAKGKFLGLVLEEMKKCGYQCYYRILNAIDYGVPQSRSRLFVVGGRKMPSETVKKTFKSKQTTVREAIADLPTTSNGSSYNGILPYSQNASSEYAERLRGEMSGCTNNVTSNNAEHIVARYSHIPQGGNWENIPAWMLDNYKDVRRCHTGVYRRLEFDRPAPVIGNFRKNMLVHPECDRGISVREAARIQSFPDWYQFVGSIGFMQQQVGNAVPPLLASAVFSSIVDNS